MEIVTKNDRPVTKDMHETVEVHVVDGHMFNSSELFPPSRDGTYCKFVETPLAHSESESSIFDDIVSESSSNEECDSNLKPAFSDEQTFCSSEGSMFGTSTTIEVMEDNQFEIIRSKSVKMGEPPSSSDEISFCISESSGFDGSVAWDASSISVRGQIGNYYNDGSDDSSNSDIGAAVDNYSSTVSVDFSAQDGGWNDETSSCETAKTDFNSLMKHWREKERAWGRNSTKRNEV